jgi:type IV pilus assembly protein PilE
VPYNENFMKKEENIMLKKNTAGFTLIELMVSLAILAIVAAIAYPSYLSYMTKTRRSDGQTALLDLANRMERYFSMNNTYAGATLNNLGIGNNSAEGFYRLNINNLSGTTYTLEAIPQGAQASDTECGTLTLDQLGQKGESGTGTVTSCW